MSNIKNRVKFDRVDCQIWKKSYVDAKGRVVLPKKLRQKLSLNSHSDILWISCKHKNGRENRLRTSKDELQDFTLEDLNSGKCQNGRDKCDMKRDQDVIGDHPPFLQKRYRA